MLHCSRSIEDLRYLQLHNIAYAVLSWMSGRVQRGMYILWDVTPTGACMEGTIIAVVIIAMLRNSLEGKT